MVEQIVETASLDKGKRKSAKAPPAQSLAKVSQSAGKRIKSYSRELDRVLGEGIVPGSVILVAGEPGIGKSTLLLKLAGGFSKREQPVLYVSGEEGAGQIKIRADRLKITPKNILLSTETDVDNIITQIEENKPSLIIIDSIQTLTTTVLSGAAGSLGQVRQCAYYLAQTVKKKDNPLFLIGHVTKEGVIAGPKVLEHLVDVVLYLEGSRFSSLRIVRGVKNRYGPTDEVGLLEMKEEGLVDVSDVEKLFLTSHDKNSPGSVVVVTKEGLRPILVEIQALVTYSKNPFPKRVGSGIDFNRLQMLLAVITKHLRLPLYEYDVYVNVASGFKISEPAADLGVCLSIISSFKNKPLPPKTVAIGEVGLLGEIRSVLAEDRRVKEARNMGYTNILTSKEKTLPQIVKNIF